MARVAKNQTEGKVKRAAIYPRVSTGQQEQEGTSLGTQEEKCRRYAAEHGYVVDEAHVYREVHTGTELWERQQLTRLRAAIRENAIDVGIAYAIDRLARDPVHLGVILTEADHHHVTVEFVTEPLDNSPEGQLIRFVRGYAAKIEHEKIRERSIRGKRARIEGGKVHNYGVELYGYRRDKSIGKRIIYEPEAMVVRRIFDWYVTGRLGIRTIVQRLRDDGIASPSIGKVHYKDPERRPYWGKGQVRRILGEPSYCGRPAAWRYRRGGTIRPETEWVSLPADTAPVIVSPSLWESARVRLETNRGELTRNAERPYLLRGLVYCVVCGRKMRSNPDRGRHTYRCASRETPDGPCGAKIETASPLEERAWLRVSEVLRNPSIISAAAQEHRERLAESPVVADREAHRIALAKLEKQQQKLIRTYRQSDEDDDDGSAWKLIERELASVAKEKAQIEAEIARLDARVAAQDSAASRIDALTDYCVRWTVNLDAFDIAKKRLALEALDVHVYAGRGETEWRVRGNVPLDGAGIVTTIYL